MEDAMFSLDSFIFEEVLLQDKLSCSHECFEYTNDINNEKQVLFYETEDWGGSRGYDINCSDNFGFCHNDEAFDFSRYQQEELQQQYSFSDYGLIDGFDHFKSDSPCIQTCLEEIAKLGHCEIPPALNITDVEEANKTKEFPYSLESLKLLNNYGCGFKQLSGGERSIDHPNDVDSTEEEEDRKLSIEEILRIAGAKFIQSRSQTIDFTSIFSHPFEWSLSGLSNEEKKDVELVELLLSAAEKVNCHEFEGARKLLKLCDSLSSDTGNPIQRVVHYFIEALLEKIDQNTERSIKSKSLRKNRELDLEEKMMRLNDTNLAYHRNIPFSQLSQVAGIQAILENVAESKKVHIIDLGIKNGMQWTILMQALASRVFPIELLKISALGTTSKYIIEETGKSLSSFALSMNLPFSFNIVMVSDMEDVKEDHFEIDSTETVAVFSGFILRTMVGRQNKMESVMRMIRNINPCVMVVNEVEANHNSTTFKNRFIEALFYYGTYFECFEAFMRRDDPNRKICESQYFSYAIRNMVATEGEERKIRHVKIDVWRAFFARFGMEDVELSTSSLYQANLVIKSFSCESNCTLDMNGNGLLIRWKGTPLHSLSVWKFVL